MAEQSWWSLFAAAFGGASSVAVLEFLYKEIKQWRQDRRDHSRNVDVSLEPLLRAADELAGKLRSLGERDFLPMRGRSAYSLDQTDVASVIFLFVQFWAEVEIVRFNGLSAEIARSERGRQTKQFLVCLQSTRVRLIDRISQRALGESALLDGRVMNFVEFVRRVDGDHLSKRWLSPLADVLAGLDDSANRQRMLQYMVVVHALIDTLDPGHVITRNRPGLANKLNKASRKALQYRVFGVYLKFVSLPSKYIGPLT
jgi:hypothetical protein